MPELKPLLTTHIVAAPSALDAAAWPADARVLRIAADEVLVIPPVAALALDDPHAIQVNDGGYVGVWLPAEKALDFLERTCEWEIPRSRPAFAQGMVAGVATRLWLESEAVLFVVAAPFVIDFQERLSLQEGLIHDGA